MRRLVDVATLPWHQVVREAWAERTATSGSLSLRFMDIRGRYHRDPARLEAVLSTALGKLSQAGQGFGELVTSHLVLVVASDRLRRHYIISKRVWASRFQDAARTDAHMLACQLIWAATAIRLARDTRQAGQALDRATIRQRCWDAQRRFLSAFDDAEEWIEHMDPDNINPD